MFFLPFRRLRLAALALLALAAAQPAYAQQAPPQPRRLEVPATATWQHAATQMILPPQSAGLRRVGLRDSTTDELDVVAEYLNESEGQIATIYLFKAAVPDVALWFDRALDAIRLRPGWGLESAPPPAVAAFARPGAPLASGLRTSFDVGIPDVRSTAIAIAPLGHFLVKVRISSGRVDAAALDAQLTRFVEGLRWPAPAADERAAVPIEPCPTPLRLRQARVVRDDMGDVLANLIGAVVEEDIQRPPPVYCREPGANLEHSVYRPGGSRNFYLIALGDAGIALTVGEALDLSELTGQGSGGRRFSMRLLDRNMTSALPSFNRLPPPEQAIAVAFGHRGETISVSTSDDRER